MISYESIIQEALTDGRDLDPLTGNSHWRHTPCRVEKLERSV